MDIVIQAPKEASGSLIRLLRSIEDADYFNARRPHLTIELPADVDHATWQYLQNFVWPPLDWAGSPHASQVSLRHRIPRQTSSEEEASARLVESFYPVRTDDSNVLLLSPNVELSPLYYHYLMYTLLEYKNSDVNKQSSDADRLMGISLHLPSTYPNDTTPFSPPTSTAEAADRDNNKSSKTTLDRRKSKASFLWQIPDSNAVLYFGNRWMEFHSFLSNRVSKPPTDYPKIFSTSHPAWLEYLLELIRARGWYVLYPNFPSDDLSLATTHSELFEVPEEYSSTEARRRRGAASRPTPSDIDPDSLLTADDMGPKPPPDEEKPLFSADLVSLLPAAGDLPEVAHLTLLTYDGHQITTQESDAAAEVFAKSFRVRAGSCSDAQTDSPRYYNRASDLFCNLDDIYDQHSAAVAAAGIQAPTQIQADAGILQKGPQKSDDSLFDFDETAMTAKEAATAKNINESSSHLSRQGQRPTSEFNPESDSNPETGEPASTLSQGKSSIPQTGQQAPIPSIADPALGAAGPVGTAEGAAVAGVAGAAPAVIAGRMDTAAPPTISVVGPQPPPSAVPSLAADGRPTQSPSSVSSLVPPSSTSSSSSLSSSSSSPTTSGQPPSTSTSISTPTSTSAASTTSAAPVKHGSFRKEIPKQPVEGEVGAAGVRDEKGLGW